MREHGVQLESWGGFAEGRNDLFTDPVLSEIGKAHAESAAQVALRRLIQCDIVIIPKSVRPERMAQNIAVFDFQLTDDEMTRIAAPRHRLDAVLRPPRSDHGRLAQQAPRGRALIRVPPTLFDRAGHLSPGIRLRSLDALHLAAAQGLGRALIAFVAYDKRLLEAAHEAKLPTMNPGAPAA
jgi:predicted nucleic acid-binding protein